MRTFSEYHKFYGGKTIIHGNEKLISNPLGYQSLISHSQIGVGPIILILITALIL